MDAEREQRLADLFLEALDRPAAEQRAFLERACGDDRELLDEALACLAQEDQLDFLERPAGEALIGPTDALVDVRDAAHGAAGTGVLETTRVDHRPRRIEAEPGARSDREASGPERTSTGAGETEAPAATWHAKLGRRWLGTYRIVGMVGEGGMGQVYAGEDRHLGRRVAVKVLPRELAGRAHLLERFEREARALAALNHPNIVTIHSIEQDEDVHFLTMELVSGQTLRQRIAGGPLPVDEILDVAIELSDALDAAHRHGIVHRDLKPVNVMLTEDGRVKILDFGIAKLAALGPSLASMDGMVAGTVAYMAPEQLEGGPVDARTDLFALGIMLFEAATGVHPFPGRSTFQRARAMLFQKPADIGSLRPGLPPELVAVIGRLLEKAPERRYPDAGTLRRDLAELRQKRRASRILETRRGARAALGGRSRRLAAALAAALLAAVASGVFFLQRGPDEALGPVAEVAGRPADRTSLAVLPFRNLTGDPQLAWLSEGIAELLVTDLAQAPRLAVLGRAEVDRLLAAALPDGTAPSDATLDGEPPAGGMRAIAERGDLQAVVRGSYLQLGDVLRLSCRLEHPAAGRVLVSASFDGTGQASVFGLVDQLGSSVLEGLGASRPDLGPETVEQATTSSVLAWQAYTEAQTLYREQTAGEAIARLETALEIDPEFALAAVAAARMHQSLGRGAEAEVYTRRAVERLDRLPLATRFSVEAGYYGARWSTLGRAIETYALALKVYPDRTDWRHHLARRYAFFERYAEALEELRRAIDSVDFWGDVQGAANVHAALGDFAAGGALLQDALAKHPDHWMLDCAAAWHFTDWGRFDQAAAAFEALAERRPDSWRIPHGRWRLALLLDDWAEADRQARRLLEVDDPFARWRGHVALARNALYRGRARQALEQLDGAVAAVTGTDRALARCFKAELQLDLGDPSGALEQARLAQAEGLEQWPELRGLFLAARAEQALGHPDEADRLRLTLQDRWRRQPNAVEERQLLHLTGLLALARGDAEAGRNALGRAAALLPVRGVELGWHVFPDHVPLWVDLGQAELAAGHPAAAIAWLEKAAAAGAERLEHPVPWVRGLYLEGLARQAAGAPAEARRRFERFLGYWDGGELDRDRLAAARSRLTGSSPGEP